MELTRLPKPNKIATLIGTFSFFVCSVIDANAKNTKSKNSTTILQKIKEFYKQNFPKKESSNHASVNQTIIQLITPTNDYKISQIILDGYRDGKPIDQTFDGNSYINFSAYDLSHQTWQNVSLMSYMQQANTQINNDLLLIATKKPGPPNRNNPSNDVATDTLLEELLGVHTFTQPIHSEEQKSIWRNFSFDFSIGAGLIWYTNSLEHIRLLQNQNHDYFFATKTKVYKPNWFHYTLNIMEDDFDKSSCVQGDDAQNRAFQGKGWGLPITLGIQYIFWNHLVVGIGKEVVLNATNRLEHNDENINHKLYIIPKKWSVQDRWFAKCGWYTLSDAKHKFFGDIRLFYVRHFGDMFARLITFDRYLYEAPAYNFGLGYEQQLTGYLSWTTRLSMEFQKFKQFSKKESYDFNIEYKQPAIYLQIGLSMRAAKCNTCNKKQQQLNDISKLEGLQNLLDLD